MNEDLPEEAEMRHEVFLSEVVQYQRAWGLVQGDGWANWSTDDGDTIFPLWSDETTAGHCANTIFQGFVPIKIELIELMEEILPVLSEQGIWVGTNLTSNMTGIDIPADVLAKKLRELHVA